MFTAGSTSTTWVQNEKSETILWVTSWSICLVPASVLRRVVLLEYWNPGMVSESIPVPLKFLKIIPLNRQIIQHREIGHFRVYDSVDFSVFYK